MDTPHYVARFKGGPLGGTEMVVQDRLSILRVPAMRSPVASYVTDPVTPTYPVIDTEEYRLSGSKARWLLHYYWVNPTASLRSEISNLKAQIARDAKVLEALAVLKEALA